MSANDLDNVVARELVTRLNEKIQHANEMIAQKLEYQTKFIEQQLTGINELNAEKQLVFSVRLEEALAEIRGYKDVIQQQLTILDASLKKAQSRIDLLDAQGTSANNDQTKELRKSLSDSVNELELLVENIRKIEVVQHDHDLVETVRATDPVRVFLRDNGKRLLVFILIAIGLYLLRNINGILEFIQGGR